MGKPYNTELQQLDDTYNWAMNLEISLLSNSLATVSSFPLFSIGSGGSLTVAHFASVLHQKYTGRIAKAITPLEVASSSAGLKGAAVLMISAGGKNPDIIGAFKQIVVQEPNRFLVICSKSISPLTQLAYEYRYVDLVDFDLPNGKDGFLATNSLLAFSVILTRAYERAYSIDTKLPAVLPSLIYPNGDETTFLSELHRNCLPLWKRENLVVLYGPSAHSAALDLESKFSEAALGAVQIADYRNFAHGRHHWLAKRGHTTGVLAFITNDDYEIANKTLKLIPPDIPVIRVVVPHAGVKASLASLVNVLHIVGFAGKAQKVDPGRPGVPAFGSKIYNLRVFGRSPIRGLPVTCSEAVAIQRKTEKSLDLLAEQAELSFWKDAYRKYTNRIQTTFYKGIVFDYDGTLCDSRRRYKGIDDEVAQHVIHLLESGIWIGIATGRGKSVKEILRSKIPQSLWPRVLVGYYNGSDAGLLGDDLIPDSSETVSKELEAVRKVLETNTSLAHLTEFISEITFRRSQITIEMKMFAPVEVIWDSIQQVMHKLSIPGVTALRSTHSVDILAPGVCKRAIVDQIKNLIGDHSSPILCIGDRGDWPGNDYALLTDPYSLSVDEVSPDPEACWNLAPAGHRGVQAMIDYFDSFLIKNHMLSVSLNVK